MISPEFWYRDVRNNLKFSMVEVQSFCQQVLSIIEREIIEENARLQIQQKNLLAKKREQKESEPWEDAPGIILEGIQPS